MSEEIKITKDDALILFEMLSRFDEDETLSIEHQSETQMLWNISSTLEKQLTEPFEKNYRQILQAARDRLINE